MALVAALAVGVFGLSVTANGYLVEGLALVLMAIVAAAFVAALAPTEAHADAMRRNHARPRRG